MQKYGKCVQPCGLFVRPDLPHLAASPDGLVGADGLLEVKCPYTGRDCMIKPGTAFPYLISRNGQLSLKRTHPYYDQVQGQMFIAQKSKCFFVIYTNVDIKCLEIIIDLEYCQVCLIPKLNTFYEKYYVEFLADKVH